jgi:hypothetical protein
MVAGTWGIPLQVPLSASPFWGWEGHVDPAVIVFFYYTFTVT